MPAKKLAFKDISYPSFDYDPKTFKKRDLTLFDLPSHERAREAIDFALKIRSKGFNVFVVGENRSGRLSSTLDYLEKQAEKLRPAKDWVYLNNFKEEHRPLPFELSAGKGSTLKSVMKEFIENVHLILNKTLKKPSYINKINALSDDLQHKIDAEVDITQQYAQERGFDLVQTDDGFNVAPMEGAEDLELSQEDLTKIKERLNTISVDAHLATQEVQKHILKVKRDTTTRVLKPLFKLFSKNLKEFLGKWVDDLFEDIIDNVDLFLDSEGEGDEVSDTLRERYGVNLFISHKNDKTKRVYLCENPTHEHLMGSINYRVNNQGGYETNFMMIRPGDIHKANGGILVLRSDTLAKNPQVWESFKTALRSKKVTIEERHRENSLPLIDAPEPHSIPLDIQVYLIGSPEWYYNFFFQDPEFRSHFKIKADIDPDVAINAKNIRLYQQLLVQHTQKITNKDLGDKAVERLLQYSSRLTGRLNRLTSRFELMTDLIKESVVFLTNKEKKLEGHHIDRAINMRRQRRDILEERFFKKIHKKQIIIDVKDSLVGQVNALTVISTGDHTYGAPNKVSTRSFIGTHGILDIERQIDMSGPIHQKGSYIIEGFLNHYFAQNFSLSCNCSLTFEQNYGEIDGDSASMAELVSILSSLSGVPVRQDLAITGSMNQFGAAQPVGGVYHKIEGFYHTCRERGLTGTQGVIIPHCNVEDLTFSQELLQDIEKGLFSIYTVKDVFEALELMMDIPCGLGNFKPNGMKSTFKKGSLFDKVYETLELYHQSLTPQKDAA